MKKLLLSLLTFTIVISLAGCSKNTYDSEVMLVNEYFDNTEEDTLEDALELFDTYLELVITDYEYFYPKNHNTISNKDTYIFTELQRKDTIYRHEFLNYHLSEDRTYLSHSVLQYLTWISVDSSILNECGEIREGEQCAYSKTYSNDNVNKYSFKFYMEGNSLVIDHIDTVSQTRLYHYIFYFYKNEDSDLVMEMTRYQSNSLETEYDVLSHTTLILGKSEETYSCNNYNPDYPLTGSLRYFYTKFSNYKTTPLDNNYIDYFVDLVFIEDYTQGTIYDKATEERFDVSFSDNVYSASKYYKYTRLTEVVAYSDNQYQVNLNEIVGWDKLVKMENEYNLYQLYYGDQLLSNTEFASLKQSQSEYAYYEYSEDIIPEEVINLSIFNFNTEYSKEYFEQKLTYGTSLFEQFLTEQNLDISYEDNYDRFLSIIKEPGITNYTEK